MANSIQSLIDTGTKLYLDSVEPAEVDQNLAWGAVGATSNPAIISGIVKAGGFDAQIESLLGEGHDDDAIAWAITDSLVQDAQSKFAAIREQSNGDAGWVSFELDPLLEDPSLGLDESDVVAKYVELGKKWAAGHTNRMIKVPATSAGLQALTPLAAAGVTLNVTLIFTLDQYRAARDAVWAGAKQLANRDQFKSVYSIFISRIDVYTQQQLPDLSDDAQGMVGILNAKRVWQDNQNFWADKNLPLSQELIFASTGTKNPNDPPYKYVQALAGSDIQTNPPETNQAVADSGIEFTRTVDQMPPQSVQDEIDSKLDLDDMHKALMTEGVDKFVKPQRALLALIAEKRKELSPSS
ncbi:Transaldolase [Rubripirellula lacrimiformis]|uniref:Transaldolase n=1 Tax=Rubripirellula lacrimiformis TaxID=1930273 RepID=A0A517NHY1_9BACT|nr:transaldolase family protein [Rubripirellula lacrimiformis]QDT06663.1 Transaldolase [Rubripirellula lacrimiformis]